MVCRRAERMYRSSFSFVQGAASTQAQEYLPCNTFVNQVRKQYHSCQGLASDPRSVRAGSLQHCSCSNLSLEIIFL